MSPASFPELARIDRVVFFKRDAVITDLICCEIESENRTFFFHEEDSEWRALLAHLCRLTDFRADWIEHVSQAPFKRSEFVAFERQVGS
jgi:hypothetical protein